MSFIFHLVWWLLVFYSVRHCCYIYVIPMHLKRKVVMRQFMTKNERMSSKTWLCTSVLLVLLCFSLSSKRRGKSKKICSETLGLRKHTIMAQLMYIHNFCYTILVGLATDLNPFPFFCKLSHKNVYSMIQNKVKAYYFTYSWIAVA